VVGYLGTGALGTGTKALFDDGTWKVPAGGGSGGALVLLQSLTASASATLDFTTFISSTYDDYLFRFIGIVPATDGVALWMRMGTGGGPTWDSGAKYQWIHLEYVAGGTSSAGNDTGSATSIQLASAITNVANFSYNGSLNCYDPGGARYKSIEAQFHGRYSTGDARRRAVQVAGEYESTTAVTGVQFLVSSGNIASGTIRVYGIAKS